MTSNLPLRLGHRGDPVRDVQQRLAALGLAVGSDDAGVFGPGTEAAVRELQAQRGLRVDGICGRETWSSLVEAGYQLGDRLLYLRQPMLRGDDVEALQRGLGALGFDAGRVDGILGPNTANALTQFQRNVGVTADGICGPDTLGALQRVMRSGSDTNVALVREAEAMRHGHLLAERRLVVGESGGLAALADAVGRALSDAGATVAVLHHPDSSSQAVAANEFHGEAYLGLAVRDQPGVSASFYEAAGFASVGGRRLAELVLASLQALDLPTSDGPKGMRLAVLRETRMPAVLCELGGAGTVVERTGEIGTGLARALTRWATEPLRDPEI